MVAMDDGKGASLRVLQWNVLADGLAQPSDFIRASPACLSWISRAPRILAAMLNMDADIMCFQELNHFGDFFSLELGQRGYSGLFHPKKSSAAEQYGCPPDGCAIFYKKSRFHLTDSEMLVYKGEDGSEQSQGAIICRFQGMLSKRNFWIATTHLKAKSGPLNDSIRKSQTLQLVERLAEKRTDPGVPLILCGDFNSEPGQEVWNILTNSSARMHSVYAMHPCVCGALEGKSLGGMEMICPNTESSGLAGGGSFTTWKFRPAGEKLAVIDYIWWSQEAAELLPCRRKALPTVEMIGSDGLPSEKFPSDHLQLYCEFEWLHMEGGQETSR